MTTIRQTFLVGIHEEHESGLVLPTVTKCRNQPNGTPCTNFVRSQGDLFCNACSSSRNSKEPSPQKAPKSTNITPCVSKGCATNIEFVEKQGVFPICSKHAPPELGIVAFFFALFCVCDLAFLIFLFYHVFSSRCGTPEQMVGR
jgi:hypothetical protein